MSFCTAFLCGSLLSAAMSFGIGVYNASHIGMGISFVVLGTGGGLILSAISLVALLITPRRKDTDPKPTPNEMLCAFFLPIIIVLGSTWLFSLQTSAN